MSGPDAVLFAVVVVAACTQATAGFGFALILAPVAAILRPELLPGGLILLMIPLNFWVFWCERSEVDRSGVAWITAGRIVGAFAAIWVLMALSARGLSLMIGASTLLAVAASVLAPRFRPDRAVFVAAGLVTGVTETATGIGGPPLALVFQHRIPAALRANVALCFLVGEVMSVALLIPAGLLSRDQIVSAILLLPGVALGIVAAAPVRSRVEARALRTTVLVFAVVSSLLIIARAL